MRQWLCLAAQGYTREDIGKELSISELTIKKYPKKIEKELKNIFEKGGT